MRGAAVQAAAHSRPAPAALATPGRTGVSVFSATALRNGVEACGVRTAYPAMEISFKGVQQ